jgi:hypothetical protein
LELGCGRGWLASKLSRFGKVKGFYLAGMMPYMIFDLTSKK